VWHEFADKIIEESKAKLASEDPAVKASAQRMLLEILTTSLKILHPFMPFVTEEIYSKLPVPDKKLLMIESWPA
jgi:valyl-tRNA synthetase